MDQLPNNLASEPELVLATLIYLSKRARSAASDKERQFLLVNETHSLITYRQAAYWERGRGVQTISGVTTLEEQAPYVQWLNRWFTSGKSQKEAVSSVVTDLRALGGNSDWQDWLPHKVLTLTLEPIGDYPGGRVLFSRDSDFKPNEVAVVSEWCEAWRDLYRADYKPGLLQRLGLTSSSKHSNLIKLGIAAALVAVSVSPVRMSILAPAEMIPLDPAVVRAPMDGVVDRMLVEPNEYVEVDQPLFEFDKVALSSRLDLARSELITTQTEYRQRAQQALFDQESKAQLAVLQSQIREREVEVGYLEALLERSVVTSMQTGLAIYEDPNDWIGRPVVTGERVMVLADVQQAQVEAWLSPVDMVEFEENAPVRVYLSADPTEPVDAVLSYLSYQPELRPDGLYAYRLRASLTADAIPRIGLKGTARVEGEISPLIYWVMRRPIASIRGWLGI